MRIVVMVVVMMLGVGLVVPQIAAADDGASENDEGLRLDWVEVAGWTLIGSGVAMEIGHFGFIAPRIDAIDSDPAFEAHRSTTPRGQDACATAERDRSFDSTAARAADLCAEADTLHVVGIFLLVGGLVSIVAGGAMLILDEDPPARGAQRGTRLSFRAGVHEDGADVGLRLRF